MLKKILIASMACLLLLSGCSKKAPEVKNVDLKALLSELQANEAFELPMSMNSDDMMVQETYGINPADLKQYAMAIPMINIQAAEIIMVEVADGKMDVVKAALDERMKTVEQTWANYLPDQFDIVKNRKTYTIGNYTFIVIAGQAEAIIKVIEDAFK